MGRFDLADRFVGLHHKDALVSLDAITRLFEELDQAGFLQAFAELRDVN